MISERALLAMLDQAKVSKANSIISCRQVRPNGTEDKPYGLFPSPLSMTGWTRANCPILLNLIANNIISFSERFVLSGLGFRFGNVMMSKTTFNRIGKWNERFWMPITKMLIFAAGHTDIRW